MKSKIRKQLAARKRRIAKRLDKTKMGSESPVISASNIEYELAERSRVIGAGGIGGMQQMVKWLELDREINRSVNICCFRQQTSPHNRVIPFSWLSASSAWLPLRPLRFAPTALGETVSIFLTRERLLAMSRREFHGGDRGQLFARSGFAQLRSTGIFVDRKDAMLALLSSAVLTPTLKKTK